MGKPEIPVENQTVHAIPFGKPQKIWALIFSDAIFPFFSVCSADLDILCSGSFSRLVKFYSFKFVHKKSTRVVCVNGEHPRFYPVLQLWGFCGFEALYPFLCTRFPPGWFVSMVSARCPVLQLWGFCGFEALYPFLCARFPPGWFVSMVSSPAYFIPFCLDGSRTSSPSEWSTAAVRWV